jgi:hypothetical protein
MCAIPSEGKWQEDRSVLQRTSAEFSGGLSAWLRMIHNDLEADMTAQEFLALSTKLFNDMKAWVAEASKADTLVPSDLAMLEASMKIIERVTLKEVETKPNTAN